MVPLKNPHQFVEFAMTLVKIFKVLTLCNFIPPCAKLLPRLTVHLSIPRPGLERILNSFKVLETKYGEEYSC